VSADDSIVLEKYLSQWPEMAASEIALIKSKIDGSIIEKIEHIGSTSVPGCLAKPIIDIAIQVSQIEDGNSAIEPLKSLGYIFWDKNPDPKHLFFVKGMAPFGQRRTHHLHFFEAERLNEHLRFRDLLRSDAAILKEYELLKSELSVAFQHDREAYTKAKGEFIERILAQTRRQFTQP
jgi:GrpB-like predicted nucleotidyltransferase (UPF0157 family)